MEKRWRTFIFFVLWLSQRFSLTFCGEFSIRASKLTISYDKLTNISVYINISKEISKIQIEMFSMIFKLSRNKIHETLWIWYSELFQICRSIWGTRKAVSDKLEQDNRSKICRLISPQKIRFAHWRQVGSFVRIKISSTKRHNDHKSEKLSLWILHHGHNR